MDYWRPVGSPCTHDRNRLDNKNFWFRCFSLSRYTDVDDRSLRDLSNVCLFHRVVSTLSIRSAMFYANLSRYLCIRSFHRNVPYFKQRTYLSWGLQMFGQVVRLRKKRNTTNDVSQHGTYGNTISQSEKLEGRSRKCRAIPKIEAVATKLLSVWRENRNAVKFV